jgi:hypothetical protein
LALAFEPLTKFTRTPRSLEASVSPKIKSGKRPADLSEEAQVAYDVAADLLNGGVLAEAAYQRAIGLFGQLGVEELIYLVGHYCSSR